MAYYESVLIARQDLTAPQVEALTNDLAGVLEAGGGTVAKRESWGLRTFAYRIRKHRKGHYVLLNIDAPAEALREYERQSRLNEDVLRMMTVRVDALEEGPSAMMQSRSSRDDRGRRDDRPRGGDREDRPRGGDREDRPRGDDRGDRPGRTRQSDFAPDETKGRDGDES